MAILERRIGGSSAKILTESLDVCHGRSHPRTGVTAAAT